MCGIAGLYLKNTWDSAQNDLRNMIGALRHRGPDAQGLWSGQNSQIHLGHARLSVIDLSADANQPMHSKDGDYTVVFNGEIYNFQDLRVELLSKGIVMRTNSDTEVLLEGYRAWGDDILNRLVGMFAFAIWDNRAKTLTLARDRVGEKPLYFADTPNFLAFASEIHALRGLAGVDTSLDQKAIDLYLATQSIPAPWSLHQGIRKLRPGEVITINQAGMTSRSYWQPSLATPNQMWQGSFDEATEELDELIANSIASQTLSDRPLGALLSGGVDSATVVAHLCRVISAGSLRTFTIGFNDKVFDESNHAAAVAKHLGTKHESLIVTEQDALNLVCKLPELYGEPIADPSAIPTYLLCQFVREQGIIVGLTGDGGDEQFGGYPQYNLLAAMASFMPRLGAVKSLAGLASPFLSSRIQRITELFGASPQELFYGISAVFSPAQLANIKRRGGYLRAEHSAWHQPIKPKRAAMVSDFQRYLPDTLLTKVDRAAMSNGLELRAPLLDHRIAEFALTLPDKFVKNKRILRSVAYKRVPKALLNRPKQGFEIPLRKWLQGALRPLVQDVVNKQGLADVGIEEFSNITMLMDEHFSGKRNHARRLWSLLLLVLATSKHSPTNLYTSRPEKSI